MANDRRFTLQSSFACSRSCRWKSRYGKNKRGLNTKIHLAVDAHGMPLRVIVTKGTSADCKHAISLIDGFEAEMLIADKGYDTNEIIEFACNNSMKSVVPSKKNRIEQRAYDEDIYKVRHLVENAFLKLKRWRSIATRYAKTSLAFLNGVILGCIVLWLRVLV